MNPRHIAFIVYEAVRAHKRVIDPKSAGPYWYDLEDPDVQASFQDAVAAVADGTDVEAAFPSIDPETQALIVAIVGTLRG